MLSEAAENGEATPGRTKPKTRTKEIRSITGSSRRDLRKALHRWVRGSTLEQADAARRPEAQERLALYVLLRDRAEDPGVLGVGAVVTHREDVILRDRRGRVEAPVRELLVHVGLPLGLAVYEQP